jgi:hypothetical protein
VSPKNALLAAAAIAVLGMGVYLFIQVRATPAQAGATHTPTTTKRTTAPIAEGSETTKVAAETPAAGSSQEPKPGDVKPSWSKAPTPTPSIEQPGTAEVDERKVDMKLDTLMELANKHYDSQDFDQATAIAGKVLAKEPNNVRMLRIMVSSNCIQGDSAVAQTHYERLPKFDRDQMKTRCDRYGVTFKDPP